MPRNGLLCLLLLSALSGDALAAPPCVTTINQLRILLADPRESLQWVETTMDDGKPLLVSIVERHGALALEFIKTGEGLWAEGTGAVCSTGADFEISFDKNQLRMGPASGWLLRRLLGQGGKFTLTRLGADQLRIATSGWRGTFVPKSSPRGLNITPAQ
jgi:hypothetical protein